ncbi:DUF6526 family protein [Paenibacillus monticola]|uniref:ABC transporter permease n=1 Tax=Paenibacillus monticola TaxID=2666075 RepID=A0A7X2KZK0_9BACL|nr:DUF6526 family protein [Paenibacillus monticola]MRN51787.1 ABC transporter permease [Paenibacillus monticola]
MNKRKRNGFMRFDWSYHFVTLPLALILLVWSGIHLYFVLQDGGELTVSTLLFISSLCLVFAAGRIRMYATKSQDRIVRIEEQFRYYRLTGGTLSTELSLAQIIALRYAGDDEFPALSQRAVEEQLKPEDILSAVQNWREDSMRV